MAAAAVRLLQLIGPQQQNAQPVDLPQQVTHLVAGVALIEGAQFGGRALRVLVPPIRAGGEFRRHGAHGATRGNTRIAFSATRRCLSCASAQFADVKILSTLGAMRWVRNTGVSHGQKHVQTRASWSGRSVRSTKRLNQPSRNQGGHAALTPPPAGRKDRGYTSECGMARREDPACHRAPHGAARVFQDSGVLAGGMATNQLLGDLDGPMRMPSCALNSTSGRYP
jgi:hypothetical protein